MSQLQPSELQLLHSARAALLASRHAHCSHTAPGVPDGTSGTCLPSAGPGELWLASSWKPALILPLAELRVPQPHTCFPEIATFQ